MPLLYQLNADGTRAIGMLEVGQYCRNTGAFLLGTSDLDLSMCVITCWMGQLLRRLQTQSCIPHKLPLQDECLLDNRYIHVSVYQNCEICPLIPISRFSVYLSRVYRNLFPLVI